MTTAQFIGWVLWPGLMAVILGGSSTLYARWLNSKAPPVEEQVRLHEERVIDRRPINHPLANKIADTFLERTLGATATTEEAVVGKEARVIEEIGMRKEAGERVETVRDTTTRPTI